MIAGKALRFAIPVALGAVVATQWPDIMRYLKIKQLSLGGGHPENVPAGGRTSYPQQADGGEESRQGASDRPAGGATARDATGIDPQETVDASSPYLPRS